LLSSCGTELFNFTAIKEKMDGRSSGNNENKQKQQGWKILVTLNKQVLNASNIFVNSMRDLVGPNCRERIIKVQQNLVKIYSSEFSSTRKTLDELEDSIVVDRNNSNDADTALKALVDARKNIDKVLLQLQHIAGK
jgi:hypothetical protein